MKSILMIYMAMLSLTLLSFTGCRNDMPTEDNTPELNPDLLIQQDLPQLFKSYEDYFYIGVALPMASFGDDNAKALVQKHFNSITAENAMKPEFMLNAGNKEGVSFITSDIYVAYAKDWDIGLRGHTLIWHDQTPSWFFREGYGNTTPLTNREDMLSRMENYIKTIMERYTDSNIYAWDVVNEAIDPNAPNYMRESNWTNIVGDDFIEKAFEYARKYSEGQDVKLFYNDYNVVADPVKRRAIYDMVKPLAEKGLIDGVGIQGHINVYGPSVSEFEATIELFGSLGLEVHVTELDISLYNRNDVFYSDPPEDLLALQAQLYKDLFDLFKAHSDVVTSVTVWGLQDNLSWLNNFPVARKNWPLLFDQDYQAKEAFHALIDSDR